MKRLDTLRLRASRLFLPPWYLKTRVSVGKVEATDTQVCPALTAMGKCVSYTLLHLISCDAILHRWISSSSMYTAAQSL